MNENVLPKFSFFTRYKHIEYKVCLAYKNGGGGMLVGLFLEIFTKAKGKK